MPKTKTLFTCPECGHQEPRWFGRCDECGRLGDPEETVESPERPGQRVSSSSAAGGVGASFLTLDKVDIAEHARFTSTIAEFDRVLGGGIVPASYVLVAGEPGAGKTTLTTQALIGLARAGRKVCLVCGEESPAQAKARFERLGGGDVFAKIQVTTEVTVERIIESMHGEGFDVVVIDSIQTVYSEAISAAPGSMSQLKSCGSLLMQAAKQTGSTVFLVGQVTKADEVAGPRALEHAVDAFLIFEGDRREQIRILRALKNRFGSTDELTAFDMTSEGLKPVDDLNKLFLPDVEGPLPGGAVCATIEGTRPLLCQVEALVNSSDSPNPVREPNGIDKARLRKIIAVLQQCCGYKLGGADVFVNIPGGLKVNDPAVDLAVAIAIASAYTKRPVRDDYCVFGEILLRGYVLNVSQVKRRTAEATRLGYKAYAPEGVLKEIIENALTEERVLVTLVGQDD